MSEPYQGTREAEYLIDRDPARVTHQLQMALRHRRRWRTWLFRRRESRFLDAFIARLELHEQARRRAAASARGMAGRPLEADVARAIAALNRSGWSIGEAALTGGAGEMVRVVGRSCGEDVNGPEERSARPEAV